MAHVDAGTQRQLQATSVLVQYVREDIVYGPHDPGGYPRRLHHLVGPGTGHAVRGRPRHPRALGASLRTESRTRWTYERSGERVVLPPGVVWWEILPVYTTVNER